MEQVNGKVIHYLYILFFFQLTKKKHVYAYSFLWKLSSASQKDVPKIKTYPWTGKNDYMILSDSDFIAIGGG